MNSFHSLEMKISHRIREERLLLLDPSRKDNKLKKIKEQGYSKGLEVETSFSWVEDYLVDF